MGVRSKSKESSFRLYKGSGTHYNEWLFLFSSVSNRPGAPGGQAVPGQPGRGSQVAWYADGSGRTSRPARHWTRTARFRTGHEPRTGYGATDHPAPRGPIVSSSIETAGGVGVDE